MVPAFEFLSYDELLIVALGALTLVLANLWHFVRYSLDHSAQASVRLAEHPLQPVAAVAARAVAATVFPHAGRAANRPLWRRRSAPQAYRPLHRPVKPQQA